MITSEIFIVSLAIFPDSSIGTFVFWLGKIKDTINWTVAGIFKLRHGSSKGREHGYADGAYPYSLPGVPILPTRVPILPTRGRVIWDPYPYCLPEGGGGGLTGTLSMGFHNGRGVYGYRERIRETIFLPPPFCCFSLPPPFFFAFFREVYMPLLGYWSMGK